MGLVWRGGQLEKGEGCSPAREPGGDAIHSHRAQLSRAVGSRAEVVVIWYTVRIQSAQSSAACESFPRNTLIVINTQPASSLMCCIVY